MEHNDSYELLLKRKTGVGRYLMTFLVMGWFGILILFPLGGIVREALRYSWSSITMALSSPASLHAFWLTILLTVSAVVINTILGTISAIVLARQRFLGRILLESLLDLPFAVSPVVAGFMLILLFGPQSSFGSFLALHQIRIIYAFPGMLLATLFVTMPFVVKEVLPSLREFGHEQEEAASILGAGRWQTFWRVTLPSIKWGLAYGITLTIARSIGEFGAILVVSGSIINRTQTATLRVHDQFTDLNYAGAFSAALILALVSFIILNLLQLSNRKKGGNSQ